MIFCREMKKFKASTTLVAAIKGFEGYTSKPYKCAGGRWTIGYGHTRNVTARMRVTPEAAHRLLMQDLRIVEGKVNALGVCKTQGQFDALCDFAFNLGCGALEESTLLFMIRRNAQESMIRAQFERWVRAGGKICPGFVKRRAWEADRYFEEE